MHISRVLSTCLIELLLTFRRRQGPSGEENIIVVLLDFGQLQFCQTVYLEFLFFFKPLVFLRKVMTRQIDPLCACHVFLWPAG